MNGPGRGLHKRFFYPGFTPRTGGLLQAPHAPDVDRRALRQRLLAGWATAEPTAAPEPHADAIDHPWVLAFCYANAPLPALLDALAHQATEAGWPPVHVWLTPGQATALGAQWLAAQPASQAPEAHGSPGAALRLHPLPHLPQAVFDHWLDACDLNLVRGEDSAVRALWPGRPHLWQLYVQDDGVHAGKMSAFTDRWTAGWPEDLRQAVLPWWRLWNGLIDEQDMSTLPALPAWWAPAGQPELAWTQAQAQSAQALRQQADLATQLMAFVNPAG